MKTTKEEILVTVAFEIRYGGEEARADAIKLLNKCPIEVSGCGPNGSYGVIRGRVAVHDPNQGAGQ